MDDVTTTLRISAAGMRTQGTRLRVIAENIANADSLPAQPGDLPYRRRVVTFGNVLDRADRGRSGAGRGRRRRSDSLSAPLRSGPPGRDDGGYVLESNVNALIEMTDMREAERSYEANLDVIRATKGMLQDTIDVLR